MNARKQKLKVALEIQAQISDAKKSIEVLKEQLNGVKLSKNLDSSFKTEITNLMKQIKKFDNLNLAEMDFSSLEKASGTITNIKNATENLKDTVKNIDWSNINNFLPQETLQRISRMEKAIKSYNTAVSKGKENLTARKASQESRLNDLNAQKDALTEIQKTKNYQKLTGKNADKYNQEVRIKTQELQNEQKTINKLKERKKWLEKIVSEEKLIAETQKNVDKDIDVDKNKYELKKAKQRLKYAKEHSGDYTTAENDQLTSTKNLERVSTALAKAEKNAEGFKSRIDIAENELKNITDTSLVQVAAAITDADEALKETNLLLNNLPQENLKKIKEEFKEIEGIQDINSIEELEESLKSLETSELQKLQNFIKALNPELERLDDAAEQSAESIKAETTELTRMTATQDDIEGFRRRLVDLFSINSLINLFSRSIRSAFDTIKELDATMTETAVVSDETVGSMWSHIDEYTDEANRLGVAINDVIAAQTLYVQQGLDLDTSLGMATETMKMARIAGMEAKDATDAMTAAIRGFGMAVDNVSAERINDVYSNLAALTASDTQELATAMSKVASIAHSANMEFENTTAFLAQIIN